MSSVAMAAVDQADDLRGRFLTFYIGQTIYGI